MGYWVGIHNQRGGKKILSKTQLFSTVESQNWKGPTRIINASPHRTTQKSNCMFEHIVQMLFELQKARCRHAFTGEPVPGHSHPLGEEPFLYTFFNIICKLVQRANLPSHSVLRYVLSSQLFFSMRLFLFSQQYIFGFIHTQGFVFRPLFCTKTQPLTINQ